MRQFRFKKAVSFLLAIAMVFTTLTVVSTSEAQAATKAIKVTNVSGSTKTLNIGKTFTIKTNYTAGKLTFKSSKPAVASVTSKGKITAKAAGTAKITIALKVNKKIKKSLTIKVKKGATNNKNNDQKQEDTRYYEKTVKELRYGIMEERYYPETGKSTYFIVNKDKENPKAYQDMIFKIEGVSPNLYAFGNVSFAIKNDEVMLFMYRGGKGDDLTKMTDADIVSWWEDNSDPSTVKFIKSEDVNYIKVYYNEGSWTNGDGDTFTAYNALIQKKSTKELYGIKYNSKNGMDAEEDVYKILDSIEIGGFTADDLRKQM